METICINCPKGCMLVVEKLGDEITVTGNTCPRGVTYGKEEITAPKRVVTSLIKAGKTIYSVKTDKPVPKEMIFDVLSEISKIKIDDTNFQIGDKIKDNILLTGANIIVTGKNKLI